jgi:hypothetical protein
MNLSKAVRDAMNVFVEATLNSGPAAIGRTMSQAAASGLFTSLTIAAVNAPAALADVVVSIKSSLPPDWEIARKNWPSSRKFRL